MTNSAPTYTIQIHMAGDIATAKQFLRQECYPPNEGICVTVRPQTFIYTGGEEEGFVIGILNYPRFPKLPTELWDRAVAIAYKLIPALCQRSALVVAPNRTEWINLLPKE